VRFTYRPTGPFSLAAVNWWLQGFPADDPPPAGDDLVRAFLSDEGEPVVVHLRQTPTQVVADVVEGGGDRSRLRAQIARLFSLEVDAEGFVAVDDPVIARLRAKHPGLRPIHFPTPYEAAVWAVLSQRTQRVQAGNIRRWLAEHHGTTFTIDGHQHRTSVPPERLVDLRRIPGVPGPKLPWLRAVARAALEGDLDPEQLVGAEPAEALRSLRSIDGIGVYSAEFILVRGAGHPDLFPTHEPFLHQLMERHYGTADATIADRWRPFRSWAAFLLRAAG
jgi:DNA-3-methyladenine glycosylase II